MDETSLTLGWLIGRRIVGQRAKGEKWETLFDGDVTTELYLDGAYDTISSATFFGSDDSPDAGHLLKYGETYRLTVDGTSKVLSAMGGDEDSDASVWIGNKYLVKLILHGTAEEPDDDGYDYGLLNDTSWGSPHFRTNFRSRTPGTYSVKLERLVT